MRSLRNHPAKWAHNGYHEIQKPPERYGVVDLQELTTLCGFTELADFQRAHRQWVEGALDGEPMARDDRWSEAIAVGSLTFVAKVKGELGVTFRARSNRSSRSTATLSSRR
jgi:REP-associated tyrosine transposase